MSTREIAGFTVDIDDEEFLTNPAQWNEDIAVALAKEIGIDPLTEEHWQVIKFLRTDYEAQGETPTLRRVATAGGVEMKKLYQLFPKKPAKKMSYVAGLQKPTGCV